MENKQILYKKLIPIKEGKFIREVDYVSFAGKSSNECLDLEIHLKNTLGQPFQKVLVSIRPRAPAIKTFYIPKKNSFRPKKGFEKSSRSRLGIGDHPSFNYSFEDEDCSLLSTSEDYESEYRPHSLSTATSESTYSSKYSESARSTEKCFIPTQLPLNMYQPGCKTKIKNTNVLSNKVAEKVPEAEFYRLNKNINKIEQNVLEQKMGFNSLGSDHLPSSDEESGEKNTKSERSGRPGCSYIQNYSHVPGTSAFQRLAQQSQTSPRSGSHAITLRKEYNSEQYGRDFTTYDGITARGRRQSASVPCKRDEYSKGAADRVHRIRHRLPPVRDYRLMDTVHYLAQGEFAPRDDGIKLTPSREAVLSDIIWEDVCRTHWPNARMPRRGHPERMTTRGELQRLIDGLLRERVQHVERRRRRHYRIVKLNHRNESCRAVGKTGDIIVASHKSKAVNDESLLSDHDASAMMAQRLWDEQTPRIVHHSYDRLEDPETRHRYTMRPEDCPPGPSRATTHGTEPTCCFRTSNTIKVQSRTCMQEKELNTQNLTSASSMIQSKSRSPRLVLNNVGSATVRRKNTKGDPNLARYIVLPTLVVRTPSNVRRQKKFNDLYHRILNVHMKNTRNGTTNKESVAIETMPTKKDIGLNFNLTDSGWGEECDKKLNPNNEIDNGKHEKESKKYDKDDTKHDSGSKKRDMDNMKHDLENEKHGGDNNKHGVDNNKHGVDNNKHGVDNKKRKSKS